MGRTDLNREGRRRHLLLTSPWKLRNAGQARSAWSVSVSCGVTKDGRMAQGPCRLDHSRSLLNRTENLGERISYRPLRGRFDEGPSKGPAVS